MTQPSVPTEPRDQQAEVEPTFDDYERDLLQAIEAGELAPTPGPIPDKAELEAAAQHALTT